MPKTNCQAARTSNNVVSSKPNTDTGASLAKEVWSLMEAYRSSYQFLDKYRELKTQEPTDNPIPNIYAQVANAELTRYAETLPTLFEMGKTLNRRILVFLEKHHHNSLLRWFENSRFSKDVAGTLADFKTRHVIIQFLGDLAYRLENLQNKAADERASKGKPTRLDRKKIDPVRFAEALSAAKSKAGHDLKEAGAAISSTHPKTIGNWLTQTTFPQRTKLADALRYIKAHAPDKFEALLPPLPEGK